MLPIMLTHGEDPYEYAEYAIEALLLNGRVIGTVQYNITPEGIDVLQAEVLEEYRRQGIATRMYDELLRLHPGIPLLRTDLSDFGTHFRNAYDARRTTNA